jgi:hypothetical protein
MRVGHSRIHDLRKEFLGVEKDEVTAPLQTSDIERLSIQMLHDPVSVRRSRDDNRGLIFSEAVSQKVANQPGERLSVSIKADGVKMAEFDGS